MSALFIFIVSVLIFFSILWPRLISFFVLVRLLSKSGGPYMIKCICPCVDSIFMWPHILPVYHFMGVHHTTTSQLDHFIIIQGRYHGACHYAVCPFMDRCCPRIVFHLLSAIIRNSLLYFLTKKLYFLIISFISPLRSFPDSIFIIINLF